MRTPVTSRLWVQERTRTKELHVGTADTRLNSADLGAKLQLRGRLVMIPLKIGVREWVPDNDFMLYGFAGVLGDGVVLRLLWEGLSGLHTRGFVNGSGQHVNKPRVGKSRGCWVRESCSRHDMPVVLETVGTAKSTKETTERCLAHFAVWVSEALALPCKEGRYGT